MTKQYYALGATPTQRKNLETLYAHLARVEKIEMDDFVSELGKLEVESDDPINLFQVREKNVCGTVCCLAGNGPLAGIKPFKKEDWFEYAKRAFGADGHAYDNGAGQRLWDWLFDASWSATDNTVAGGRARIRMALDEGVPVNYLDQLWRRAPVSYMAALP